MDAKKIAAEKAADYVKGNMTVGLGTGSTVFYAIHKLGEMVKNGLKIMTVSSSVQSEKIARELNIPTVGFEKIQAIDIYIDGADEVDQNHYLIKGGGGALLREKIIAFHSHRYIVVADESKMVKQLGKFPLPVEVVPFALSLTLSAIAKLGAEVVVRQKDGKDFISDNGNLIADCHFGSIPDPGQLNQSLHMIPGVVETGIFLNSLVSEVVVGYNDGRVQVFN
ncbi:MAG: ribose-5-phosphate isomerase RpiA [Chitinophagaceae bacterium]|nr:MAG: ribose-5-phosphate isomerase RpiA [Chitinophagaceae bacterium]